MALKKLVVAPNGIPLDYHRVAMVKIDTNQQCTILVHSYLNESARQYELDYENGKIEGEPTFPYVDAQYIVCDYSPDMTVSKAYEWMKENIAEFKDAEDI